jgi:hypothetical protein
MIYDKGTGYCCPSLYMLYIPKSSQERPTYIYFKDWKYILTYIYTPILSLQLQKLIEAWYWICAYYDASYGFLINK